MLHPYKMLKLNRPTTPSVDQDTEDLELSHKLVGMYNSTTTLENSSETS